MRKRVPTFFLFILIISSGVVYGKADKNKAVKANLKKQDVLKDKPGNERIKRSINENNERHPPFWPNRGKKQIDDDSSEAMFNNDLDNREINVKSDGKILKDEPFWANRGRRDSGENYDYEYPDYLSNHCKHCDLVPNLPDKNRRDDFMAPFWGSRGRRNSLEDTSEPFWGNRGRRQEKIDPFWGNRGRRTEDEPFWGNRGRREEEPFWGNRGRREDLEPFWGNRGRREDNEPFWGNRGRRQDNEPFWGNRGRREEEPFWSNRGRRKYFEPMARNIKEDFKESIKSAISDIQSDIENLSRLKRANHNSFWANRGRESKMSFLFNSPSRYKSLMLKAAKSHAQKNDPGTVLDSKMYVDEPKYILVERMGRSSGEIEDPYYISRGKKYYLNNSLQEAVRDRRGAIEEIVKSVRNDPYYIARGKKDIDFTKSYSNHDEDYSKAKDLICAAIDLTMSKKENGKVKRQVNDNDRDRRTTLKKLAAQLQADPYFVSRGKKSENGKDNLQQFISNLAEQCN